MPGGNKAIRSEDGKPFSSTYQPFRSGRRPIVFSEIAMAFKASGIERATDAIVIEAFEYLLSLPLSEVISIADSPKVENDLPSMYRLVAKEMIGKNGQRMIEQMLDRAHGKSKQQHEHSGKDGGAIQHDFSNVSDEEMDAMAKIILKTEINGGATDEGV